MNICYGFQTRKNLRSLFFSSSFVSSKFVVFFILKMLVKLAKKYYETEASGNITLKNVKSQFQKQALIEFQLVALLPQLLQLWISNSELF